MDCWLSQQLKFPSPSSLLLLFASIRPALIFANPSPFRLILQILRSRHSNLSSEPFPAFRLMKCLGILHESMQQDGIAQFKPGCYCTGNKPTLPTFTASGSDFPLSAHSWSGSHICEPQICSRSGAGMSESKPCTIRTRKFLTNRLLQRRQFVSTVSLLKTSIYSRAVQLA